MAEVFVMEGSPPKRDLPRWGCHGTSGLHDVDEAVAGGLANAETVFVRTLDGRLFWAGVAPPAKYRPWPPSDAERRRIDEAHLRAIVAEERAELSERAFVAARERWLSEHVPELVGLQPPFVCWVVPPRRDGARDLLFD
jgi:hypothetical protein